MNTISVVSYQVEEQLDAQEFVDILQRSTLAERRPVHDIERIQKMCANANLIVTARQDGLLIGVARSISDFTFCTYLSDLAVDVNFQHQGIGKKLIALTKQYSGQAKVILLAAPAAEGYYPKIGMTRHEHCYLLSEVEQLN